MLSAADAVRQRTYVPSAREAQHHLPVAARRAVDHGKGNHPNVQPSQDASRPDRRRQPLALVGALAVPSIAQADAKTVLVSKSSGGAKGNNESGEPTLSRTGRYIGFQSRANNLVADDTNGTYDCFVRDQGSSSTERVSVTSGGGQSNGPCWGPAISQGGQHVAFYAAASNLAPGDDNGEWDIFVHDRDSGATELVSFARGGGASNGQSADPAISGDGQIVAFESKASDLVEGDTNGAMDVFVHDRGSGTTTRVSVHTNGAQGNGSSRDPSVSAGGRFVVFDSEAGNLVNKDTNGRRDVFIHDLASGKTQRVSVTSGGRQATGVSGNAVVSSDGRYVAFDSKAANLVGGDTNASTDVFLRDRNQGKTTRVSVTGSGKQATGGWSLDPTISDNGRYIAFESAASNLVSKDTNRKWDVFLRDRINRSTKIISLTASGARARKRQQ